MLESRVRLGAARISGPGAKSHADIPVSRESGRKPNFFTDPSAAKTNPLVRIYYTYNDTDTGTHENGTDLDIPVTRARAKSTHGEGEENCDDVALRAIESGHKRTSKDENVGTKKRNTRSSHQADDLTKISLADDCSSAETLRHDSRPDNMSSGNYTNVSFHNEVSSTLDEEPTSSFEKPDSYNSSEETADEEQEACKGLERFCLERGSPSLNIGEPSLEELVVRSNFSMSELMSKRDTFEFDTGLICLPLSRFKPHHEDRSLDHTPTYVKSRTTQDLGFQSLNTTIVPGRAARIAVPISELSDPSNLDHSSPQNLDDCAATLKSQNEHQVDGKSKSQHKQNDLHLPSEACADQTAQRMQSTSANAVDHSSKASNHEISTQPAIGESFVVDLICRVCSRTCVSLSKLTTHMSSHTGETPFACAECDKRFPRNWDLTRHTRSHTGEKPFACVECDKRCSRNSDLSVHMRSHTGEKPFACTECDKRFTQKSSLSRHMRSHTGERP
ncbi:hypothetical protein OXX79_007596 [Metschnikowia pulcherrima]